MSDLYDTTSSNLPNYRPLMEINPDGVAVVNLNGTITDVNFPLERMTGYTRDELLFSNIKVYFSPSPLEWGLNHGGGEENKKIPSAVTLLEKNGQQRNVSCTAAPYYDESGNPQGMIISLRDMIDSKFRKESFQRVLETTPDAMIMINEAGKIIFINSQTEKIFGYKKDELMGQLVEILIPKPYRERHPHHREKYFAAPHVRPMGIGLELYGLRKNGEHFPVEISLSPFDAGEDKTALAAIRDITERKRFELTLQEKNLELENANLAKDRFLASMSHELRTPLNAIIGFTGTLLMHLPGPLNEEQEKQLKIVQGSAKHLLSLINDLLDLAKIESGKVDVTFETLSCQSVIEEVVLNLAPMAESKNLTLEVDMPERELWIETDRRSLTQIIINLVNNAIKFTESGGVRIKVQQINKDGKNLIGIHVIDTGIGIKEEDQSKLFNAFQQMAIPGKRVEGTGLGLHVSHKLAALIQGAIEFESAYEKGSRFSLFLPSPKG